MAEARAVTRIHGDDLDAHSVVSEATNNGATPDLADRHVEEDLHGAAERDFFLSANVKTAEGEVFDIADIAMSSGLPSDNHTLGRLDARMLPLFLILHNAIQGGRIAGQRSLAALAGNENKSFLRIHALGGWSLPTRPQTISALR